jgi:hypothetical protein
MRGTKGAAPGLPGLPCELPMTKWSTERHDPETDAPASSPASGTAQSTLNIIRSLERASHDLEKTLTVLRRDSEPPVPSKHASGVRGRAQGVLVVAVDDPTRRFVVDRLRAAGFFVDWACDAESGRQKAAQCAPDVVVVDRGAEECAEHEFARMMETDPQQGDIAVLTVDSGMGGGGRSVAVFPWRDSEREIRDVVRAIARETPDRPPPR